MMIFQLQFIGEAGEGELRINPIMPASDKYYEPNIMEKIIHNKTRQTAVAQNLFFWQLTF